MKKLLLLAMTTLLLLTTGCSLLQSRLTRDVNRLFPPVAATQQRQDAISSAAASLSVLTAPNVAFTVPLADVQRALDTDALRQEGLASLHLATDEQLLRIELDFSRRFDDAGPEAPPEIHDLVRRLTPQVTGRLTVLAGVATTTATDSPTGSVMRVKLLPVFRTLKVTKLVLAQTADVTLAGKLLAFLLNRYADNVTGILSRAPLTQLTVPASFDQAFNATRKFVINGSGVRADLTVDAHPVAAPVRLLGTAMLISDEQIAGIAQFIPTNITNPPPGAPVNATFSDVKARFRVLVVNSFAPPSPAIGPWVAIRRDLIATLLNSAIGQAAACITASGETDEQNLNQEIRFPDESTIDCTPDRDCSPKRPCDFEPCHDTRGCNRCLVPNPFGGCLVSGNDPSCEAAKALENARCAAEAAGRKLDCERLKEQEKLTCEAEKATQKGLCEAGKEFLKRLARTGKFGRVEAGARIATQNLRVCLRGFELTSDIDHVRALLSVDGDAAADVSLKFTPLDIVGHLTCQAPFTDSRTFHASLRKSDVTIESDVQLVDNGDGAAARFQVKENTVGLHLQPGPTEFLLTSVNATLACQGLNLVKPLILSLTPFVPQLRGDIDHTVKQQEVTIPLPLPNATVGTISISGKLRASPQAVFLFTPIDQ